MRCTNSEYLDKYLSSIEQAEKELILLEDLGYLYPKETSKQRKRFGIFKCHCGKEFKTQTQGINNGNTKSCGCLKNTHNLTNHRLYQCWNSMIQRCTNPKSTLYKNYGERGIKVSNEWLDINNFINDMYPSHQEGLSIDRIDNNKGYSKDNCRWATRNIQARNIRVLKSNNKSGYRGVHWYKISKKWVSQTRVNRKLIYLGCYNTAIEAAKAYDKYIIDNNLEHTKNF